MDELDLIRERADTVGFAPAEHLTPARERLLAAARGERPHRSRRWFWVAGASIGLAAAITAVVTLAPAEQVGIGVGVANADPVRVLTEAASAALKEPVKPPRPDQFLYVKTEYPDHHTREIWLSVDGTRDGLLARDTPLPGCHDGKEPYSGPYDPAKKGTLEDCRPSPAYHADLPTTADAMLAYLNTRPSAKDSTNSMGKTVLTLADEQALPPAAYAALFEAAAKVPGLKALDHVTDGAGRPGIGITWPQPGSRPGTQPLVLVFDTTTHQFLGTQDSAVTVKTFVDEAGQRPSS
ncbi:CU044_5270 family protein [Amycolatopsis sp. OK19-0408]|uniref:CU044_5270 family protein n=1 Tax=Amycolatopsis iheyensis TaxID=2945988 RepID=A0A9X2NCA5_9PSEU|nr:CU044_5270 family protein [Amycolatopsis iheyensis]MCR6485008.1 CU044_5270 family protein [Amycolatopsis iheyensis]